MRYVDRRRAQSPLMLALAAVGIFAAACGGSSGGKTAQVTTESTTQAQSPAAGASVSLTTHKGPMGTYLTDSKGRSLYVFAADTGSSSTCSGSCATEWPPLTGSSATAAGSASSSMVGTSSRSDGSMQITYAGHPLYMFTGDAKAGDTKGQGLDDFGGKWTLVDAQGSPITAAAPASSSSSSSSGGDGWG